MRLSADLAIDVNRDQIAAFCEPNSRAMIVCCAILLPCPLFMLRPWGTLGNYEAHSPRSAGETQLSGH